MLGFIVHIIFGLSQYLKPLSQIGAITQQSATHAHRKGIKAVLIRKRCLHETYTYCKELIIRFESI